MWLINLLWESIYGKARYNVKFIDIESRKSVYPDDGWTEKHEIALCTAESFLEKNWFLTESGTLVCGHIPKLDTLHVSIGIGRKNGLFLASQYEKRIREGYAVNVVIDGLDIPKGEVTGPRPGLWVNFLGTPE